MKKNRITDLRLLEAILNAPGATDTEIGAVIGLSRVQVLRRRNTPEFKKLLSGQIQASMRPFLLARCKAVRRLCSAIDSSNERIAIQACQIVLSHALGGDSDSEEEEKKNRLFVGLPETLERMSKDRQDQQEKRLNFEKHRLQLNNKDLHELQSRRKSK